MSLKGVGEFDLITMLTKDVQLDRNQVIIGIGDDTAVLKQDGDKLLLASTDTLTEGIHFLLSTISPWQLGYKSVAVNVSDIAAMGGLPTALLVSIALPSHLSLDWVKQLYQGIKSACHRFQVNLVGGDTVHSLSGVTITATILGQVEPGCLILRSGAKPGDLVAVTGTLGASAAGLTALTEGLSIDFPGVKEVIHRHLQPEPQVVAGRRLAETGKVSSLNDVSDGLASEVLELVNASGVGVELDGAKVPIDSSAQLVAEYTGNNPLDWALYGGEDYQLVFTLSVDGEETVEKALNDVGCTVTVIGRVIDNKEIRTINLPGQGVQSLRARGYNHFGV